MCPVGLLNSKTSQLCQTPGQEEKNSPSTMKTILATLKRELKVQLFGLGCEHPRTFLRCQWQAGSDVSPWYLVYRWIVTCYFGGTLSFNLYIVYLQDVELNRQSRWYLFMTYWGYMLCTVQAFLGAILLSRNFCQHDDEGDGKHGAGMSALLRLYWVLHTAALDMSFTITSIFWVVIYTPTLHRLDFVTISNHVFNSVVMAIDFLLVSHPTRLLHFLWPFSFLMTYFLFSVVYFWMGGTQIYAVLDWHRPVRTATICSSAVLYLLFVHFSIWVLHLARRHLAQKMTQTNQKQDEVNMAFITSSQV